MKGARRKARKDSLMILYQLELNKTVTPENAIEYFKQNYTQPEKSFDEFTQRLVQGVIENSASIDQILEKVSSHWKRERMATVDRNLLRLGVYELCYCDDIPATVTINEMIEIAKEFSSEKSASFINGILDKVRLENPRPKKAP